jgi:formylglycine-generating enzyme required for sulfatase activity
MNFLTLFSFSREMIADTIALRGDNRTVHEGLVRNPVGDSTFTLSTRSLEQSTPPNMVWIPGGTFRMGSDQHYPEEAPVHRVSVNGFWIDRTPVANRQFKEFVRATGHKTFAELHPTRKTILGRSPTCSMPDRWFSLHRRIRST